MDIGNKSIGFLIDELFTTNMKCWFAQEDIMNEELSESTRLKSAIRTQQMNARRNTLIRKIDELLGQGELSPTSKTYEVNFRYATILRNPIDRCLSHWKEVNSYLSIINSTLSLDQFIEHPIYKKLFNNYQSRYLGFFPDWTTIAGTNNAEHHLTFATMEMDIDDNILYTNCISTLDKFESIGIKEYFQESVLLAEKILKFSHYIPREKRTDYSSYLSDDIVSFLKKSNEVDFEVYRYAVKKFWEMWH